MPPQALIKISELFYSSISLLESKFYMMDIAKKRPTHVFRRLVVIPMMIIVGLLLLKVLPQLLLVL